MGEWRWTTYAMFAGIALLSTFLIKMAEKHSYVNSDETVKKYDTNGKLYYFLVYLILIVFCVIHNIDMYPLYTEEYPVQTVDMQAYIHFFQNGSTDGWNWKKILTFNQWEPMFYTVNLIIRSFTTNYRVYWFILYSFYIICLLFFASKVFDKEMDYVILPFFITGLLYGMCALRSCIANAICLLALYFLQRKKVKSFIVAIIMATLFHYTAIFVLPVMVVTGIGMKLGRYMREKAFSLLGIGLVTICLLIPIGASIIEKTKYKHHLGNSMTLIGQAPLVCCAVAALLFFNSIRNKYPDLLIYVYIVFYNFLLMPFIVEFNIYRIGDFFLLPRMIVWTMVVGCLKDKVKHSRNEKVLISMVAFIIMMLWMLKTIYDNKGNGIMPYLNSWI